jgi:GNAT superfamily N-acetyltransferase
VGRKDIRRCHSGGFRPGDTAERHLAPTAAKRAATRYSSAHTKAISPPTDQFHAPDPADGNRARCLGAGALPHSGQPELSAPVRRGLLGRAPNRERRAGGHEARQRVPRQVSWQRIVASLTLSTRKPWAIDAQYFHRSVRPLYLTSMAVDPRMQGKGVGRLCMEQAQRIAREWPADAIRLDAWNAEAGAGEFYRKCGYREVGRALYRKTSLIYFELLL